MPAVFPEFRCPGVSPGPAVFLPAKTCVREGLLQHLCPTPRQKKELSLSLFDIAKDPERSIRIALKGPNRIQESRMRVPDRGVEQNGGTLYLPIPFSLHSSAWLAIVRGQRPRLFSIAEKWPLYQGPAGCSLTPVPVAREQVGPEYGPRKVFAGPGPPIRVTYYLITRSLYAESQVRKYPKAVKMRLPPTLMPPLFPQHFKPAFSPKTAPTHKDGSPGSPRFNAIKIGGPIDHRIQTSFYLTWSGRQVNFTTDSRL